MVSAKVSKTIITCFLLIISTIIILPFILTVSTSLKSYNEIYSGVFTVIPKEMHFDNYIIALSKGDWLRYFSNSLYVSLSAIIISLVINSMAGFAFARIEFKGRDILFFLAIMGLMIPPQVTYIPVYIILKHIPFAGGNNILGMGGLGFINSLEGIIAPHVAGALGVFLFRQYFISFPKALDDAAKIDGCSWFKAYLRIYLPLSKPMLATLTILKGVYSWNEYSWPLILTTNNKLYTVQLGLTQFRSERGTEWNLLMAATVVTALPIVIGFLFAQKYFVEGIVASGIKG
jgi:multiple sugar transport system permease protein